MMRAFLTSATVLAIAVCAVAQSETSSPRSVSAKKASIYAELTKAPAKATAKRNPLEHDPEAVAAGGKLFAEHCAECHGELANGGRRGPSLRAEQVQKATAGALFWLLTNGVVRRGMPVWSKLPEPQRWELVSFIQSLGAGSEPKANGSAPFP